MAINTYLSTIESNKQNKWTSRRETDSYAENILTFVRWEGVGGIGEKVKELRCTNWLLQNPHRDVKYCIGNTINNTVMTMCVVRWILGLLGWSLSKLCLISCVVHLKHNIVYTYQLHLKNKKLYNKNILQKINIKPCWNIRLPLSIHVDNVNDMDLLM